MFKHIGITTLLCIAALGCSKAEPAQAPAPAHEALAKAPEPAAPAAPAPAPAAAAADPQALFKERCVMCHGESGKGDGPAAAALNPKPRDYTDAAWQKTVTDDQIKKAITGGGAAVGKSPTMPGQPDLANQPQTLEGLVKLIRSFATS